MLGLNANRSVDFNFLRYQWLKYILKVSKYWQGWPKSLFILQEKISKEFHMVINI